MMDYAVVTICLDSAETVARTIRSVLKQTPPPAQYVFVDGGSEDETVDIINSEIKNAETSGQSIEFSLLKQERGTGIPNAWNTGLATLRTDLIFLLNSDDWYGPETAETVVSEFSEHPDLDILIAPVRFWDPSGKTGTVIRSPKPFCLFPVLMPVMHPGCFLKRAVYDAVGQFDEDLCISADYDFVYRCFNAGMSFQKYPEPLVNMQTGGRANRNRSLARKETCEVALRHSGHSILPRLAYIFRWLLNR